MKKRGIPFIMPVVLLMISISSVFGANPSPSKGGALPVINLPIPKNTSEKAYLGLSGDGLFKIPQIKSKVVIIEPETCVKNILH